MDRPGRGPTGFARVPAWAMRDGQWQASQETVADEVPVALEYNGVSHVVMMATPLALDDFALGFSLTEGLIDAPADLLDFEEVMRGPGIVLQLSVTAHCEARLKQRRRNLAGRTGCGLCGVDSLDQVLRPAPAGLPDVRPSLAALTAAMDGLHQAQPLQQATGGMHAAAWCGIDGNILLVREDVGRHNALDKLVGAIVQARLDPGAGFVAVTSRASMEMVQKAAQAGIGALAAVSAPTRLAIDLARQSGLMLAGFVRDGRATVFNGQAGAVTAPAHGLESAPHG